MRPVTKVLAGTAMIAACCMGAARPAAAQPYSSAYPPAYMPRLQGHVMLGYSATSGVTSDYLQGGWLIDGGATYWPGGGALGIRADLSYAAHSATRQFIAFGERATGQEIDDGTGELSSIAAGLVLRAPQTGYARFYGLAQAGLFHVRLRLTQSFYVPGYFCDPFFGYCNFAFGAGAQTRYERTATKFGWDVGVGVDFPGYFGRSWFIEAQYRRMETSPHPFEYWPITVGYRF